MSEFTRCDGCGKLQEDEKWIVLSIPDPDLDFLEYDFCCWRCVVAFVAEEGNCG